MSQHDEMEWAFLDGEMTASESAEFEQTIAPGTRDRLAARLDMENELAETLSTPVECPKAVWQEAVARVRQRQVEERRAQRRPWRYAWLGLPIAATIALCAYIFYPAPAVLQPEFLSMKGKDLTSVAARSQVTDGVTGVRAFMDKMALPVALNPSDDLDGQHAPYRLLGVCAEQYYDESVVQLLFDCSGAPASVVIARSGGSAALAIGKAVAAGTVHDSRSIGGVVVAVVGEHACSDLIGVVNDHWPEAKSIGAATPAESSQPEETPSNSSLQPETPLPHEPGAGSPVEEAPGPAPQAPADDTEADVPAAMT